MLPVAYRTNMTTKGRSLLKLSRRETYATGFSFKSNHFKELEYFFELSRFPDKVCDFLSGAQKHSFCAIFIGIIYTVS